jgi:hypothetical protein
MNRLQSRAAFAASKSLLCNAWRRLVVFDETMSKLGQYFHAARRDNTRQSYQSAIRHFEVEWQ